MKNVNEVCVTVTSPDYVEGVPLFPASEDAIKSDTRELLCISLWQPWATWIAWGWKKIETRLHPRFASLAGKRIGIHAAQKFDDNWHVAARPFLDRNLFARTISHNHVRGALICAVSVKEHCALNGHHSQSAMIDCESTPRFGLILRPDIKIFQPPLPMRGHQGIFTTKISWPA